MKIRLKQVMEAIEMADDAYTAFWDRQTGETVFLDDPDITGMKNGELETLLDAEPDRFYPFPTKYEIHEYSMMEAFVEELPPGKAQNELAGAIRGRGAFRRFKNGIRYFGIEQQWYDYLAEAYREIAIHWCRDNGLEYKDEETGEMEQKKILVVQGSGRANGNTAQLVKHFVRGAEEAGHQVEVISLIRMK